MRGKMQPGSQESEADISVEANGTFSDEREVLSVCLNHLRVGNAQVASASTKNRLTDYSGVEEQYAEYLREGVFSEFKSETLHDFLAKNREEHPVDPDLNPEGRLICLSDEELGRVFRGEDGWNRFMREYPGSGGTIDLSRVGLDKNLAQAMIYIGQQFHWTAGSGECYVLSKSDGKWTVEGEMRLWIS